MKRATLELTESECERLAKGDWRVALGEGVRVPTTLQSVQRKLLAAAEVARDA